MTTILSHSIYYSSKTTFNGDGSSSHHLPIAESREQLQFNLLDCTSKTLFQFCSSSTSEAVNLQQRIIDSTIRIIESEKLITVQEGNIPLIISIPHGGKIEFVPQCCIIRRNRYFLPSSSLEQEETNNKQILIPMFADGPDENTLELGNEIESHLIHLLNTDDDTAETSKQEREQEQQVLLRPFIVRAHIHRQHVDLNRPPGRMAHDSLQGETIHRYYHQHCLKKRCCDVLSKTFESVIFIDLHGHAVDSVPGDSVTFFRGTRNGLTWKKFLTDPAEVKTRGASSLIGPWSILGYLSRLTKKNEEKGDKEVIKKYNVSPFESGVESEARRVSSIGKEDTMQGGYIVQSVAEARNDVIQGIQLETGIDHRRTKEQQEETGKDIAEAINCFLKMYMSEEMKLAQFRLKEK